MLEAHKNSFDYLCSYIEEHILHLKVERMTMLLERYLLYLSGNHPDYCNENYKREKLKEELRKHFGNRIQFWKPSSRGGELVYSEEIATGQAVEVAFELAVSDERRIEEADMIIRRNIVECQNSSGNVSFPPTISWLLSEERQPPNLLRDFLSHVVSGKSHTHLSEKPQRFVSSCSQDICYAVTNGQWLMPKHILLAMTVHHLTGSAEIITILNRFEHCQSYSLTLEPETAMCRSVTDNSSHLPPSISTDNNVIVHLCWDNFDFLYKSNPYCAWYYYARS